MSGTLEQKKILEKRGGLLFLAGLLAFAGAMILLAVTGGRSDIVQSVSSLAFLGGMVCCIVGSCFYAKSKGYSVVYGFFGIVMLAILPDQYVIEDGSASDTRAIHPKKASLW